MSDKATKNIINTPKIAIEKPKIATKPNIVTPIKIARKPKIASKPKIVTPIKIASKPKIARKPNIVTPIKIANKPKIVDKLKNTPKIVGKIKTWSCEWDNCNEIRHIIIVFWDDEYITELCEKWVKACGVYAYTRFEELSTNSGDVLFTTEHKAY